MLRRKPANWDFVYKFWLFVAGLFFVGTTLMMVVVYGAIAVAIFNGKVNSLENAGKVALVMVVMFIIPAFFFKVFDGLRRGRSKFDQIFNNN